MKYPFKIGDNVITDYHWHERNIVRTITQISKDKEYSSGFSASADSGKPCKECGRKGSHVDMIDSSWFSKV